MAWAFRCLRARCWPLIGPNGAGKSTTFNMVGGQLRPDAGDVRLAGESLVGLPRAPSGAGAWAAPSRSPKPSAL